jgi:glutamyl-Q tRNA(Asp) synthetase
MRRKSDQIVSVGAITVAKNHQMRGASFGRGKPWTVKRALTENQSRSPVQTETMFVTRFAPSPTGYLHLGHAFAAMSAREAAQGGRFLLRIEDLDASRAREAYVEALFADLRWLGLSWEEPVLRQSTRTGVYRSALEELGAMGLVYPCFCTRGAIAAEIARSAEAPHGPDGPIYPGTCRQLLAKERVRLETSGAPYAMRLNSGKAAEQLGDVGFEESRRFPHTEYDPVSVDPLLFGDVVLGRKDTPVSYHLAVVIDDAAQGTTLVTRGRDLFHSTHVHRMLQSLLGLPAPKYAHHRLILDADGRKLSKREFARSLQDLRCAGVTAEEIAAMLQRA